MRIQNKAKGLPAYKQIDIAYRSASLEDIPENTFPFLFYKMQVYIMFSSS